MLLFVIVVVPDLTRPQRKEKQMMKTKNGWETTLTIVHRPDFSLYNDILQRKNGSNQGKRRVNNKIEMVRREEMVRSIVYVFDIDQIYSKM
ncbi:hypothetical protein Lal_00034386 [Lupinus albus]|nr:hypothetical protein Lal_00034386 [Lupinus albus]